MENRDDIKNPGQNPTVPTDKGEDSEERRDAAAEQSVARSVGGPRRHAGPSASRRRSAR